MTYHEVDRIQLFPDGELIVSIREVPDFLDLLLNWIDQRNPKLTKDTYIVECKVHYFVKFIEDRVYLSIRPTAGYLSDIKPSEGFSIHNKAIVNWLEFLKVVELNKTAVLDYLEKRRLKNV